MKIEYDLKLNFSDVLIKPQRSSVMSRKDVDLTNTFHFPWSKTSWRGIPIIATNMDTVGTVETARILKDYKMLTWIHKFEEFIPNDLPNDYYAPTIGETFNNNTIDLLKNKNIPFRFIRVDAANGYRDNFISFIKKLRNKLIDTGHSDVTVFAGTVCTPEMTQAIINAGADVAVIGIGSGGQCTTRLKTGVGYPQLSAILECSEAALSAGGYIVSDGGCRMPGDVCKAFAAGADFVSLGSMLAGHDQNTKPHNFVYGKEDNKGNKPIIGVKCYGMSSKKAMNIYYNGVAEYRTDEGRETIMPYRGNIHNTILDILGGLRSACSYVGAKSLSEFYDHTTFIRVTEEYNSHWVDKETK